MIYGIVIGVAVSACVFVWILKSALDEVEREMTKLERVIIWFLVLLLGMFLGYLWRTVQIANAYETPVKVGWALPKDDPVRLAMNKMGPRYAYKLIGETLYVDTGSGVWRRLRYERH